MFKNIKAKIDNKKMEKEAYNQWHDNLSTEELASLYMAKKEQRKDRACTIGAGILVAGAVAALKIKR